MECKYGDIWLTGSTPAEWAYGWSPEGQRLADITPMVEREYAKIRPFGNRTMEIPLGVDLAYATPAEAFIASVTHVSWPESATLRVQLELGGVPVTLSFPNSILLRATPKWSNAFVRWSFAFQVAQLSILEGPIPEMDRTGLIELTEGSDEGEVVFAEVMLGSSENVRLPQPSIIKPSESADNFSVVSIFDVTTSGFKFTLSGTLTAEGYQLSYTAKNVNV